MKKNEFLGQEHRQYLRLDTVFPVQFRIESFDGNTFLSSWQQGFTNNVSKGGICLCVNNLAPNIAQTLKERQVKLSIEIDMPISNKPVAVRARPVWIKSSPENANKYYIGLSYENMDAASNRKIMSYAWGKKLFAPLGLGIIILLGLGLILNGIINLRLVQGNKILVQQLVNTIQESDAAKEKIKSINSERAGLQIKISELETRIQTIEAERSALKGQDNVALAEQSQKIEELNILIQKLSKDKDSLKSQLSLVQEKESSVSEELLRIDKKKATLEKANFDKMYQWVQVHQNPRTGLVVSFEGDNDMKGWSFTYDQSLASQAFTMFDDFERAHKVLDFFNSRAKRKNGLFFNAYYVSDGEPAEYIVHSGPNIWLGIAIAQYIFKTQDNRYLPLAEEIAQSIIDLQSQDADGGIKGGPDVPWYATEHNLDAYAFFNMLYKITGNKKYAQSRDKVLSWLLKHTYDSQEVPVRRGKGDSTIATDTYAWSIAAIGPEALEKLGMSPDRIMEFAENNCAVEVSYKRPEGQVVRIKGFDFSPQMHTARGGVVSSEWTAQMVISFKIMSDYYLKKGMTARSRNYGAKAEDYLANLGNMIISSPSPSGQGESCLPYATQDFVDTGHGWLTPKGKSTGSVAGTTYTIFAYYNYNPLELKN